MVFSLPGLFIYFPLLHVIKWPLSSSWFLLDLLNVLVYWKEYMGSNFFCCLPSKEVYLIIDISYNFLLPSAIWLLNWLMIYNLFYLHFNINYLQFVCQWVKNVVNSAGWTGKSLNWIISSLLLVCWCIDLRSIIIKSCQLGKFFPVAVIFGAFMLDGVYL